MYIIFILYKKTDQSYNNRVTSESRKMFSYFNISRLPIALAFDFQVLDSIPTTEYDIPVDVIVTETTTIQIK